MRCFVFSPVKNQMPLFCTNAHEVLIGGTWQKVAASVSPAYPNGNSQNVFGSGYETYTFTLKESVLCQGVRISGAAGGNGDFISVNELVVG